MSICADRSFRRGSQDLHLNGDTILHLLPIVFLSLCIFFFSFQFFLFLSVFYLSSMPSIITVKWKKSKYLCNQAHQLYSNTSTLDPSIFLMPRNILKLSFLYGSSNQILLSTQSENGILQIREIPMITPDFSWKKVHIERTFRESRSNEVQIRTKLNVSLLFFSHPSGHARHIWDIENRKCLCAIAKLHYVFNV